MLHAMQRTGMTALLMALIFVSIPSRGESLLGNDAAGTLYDVNTATGAATWAEAARPPTNASMKSNPTDEAFRMSISSDEISVLAVMLQRAGRTFARRAQLEDAPTMRSLKRFARVTSTR